MRSAGFEPAFACQRDKFQTHRVYQFRHDRALTSHDVGAFVFGEASLLRKSVSEIIPAVSPGT